jgi:hypothetical protein
MKYMNAVMNPTLTLAGPPPRISMKHLLLKNVLLLHLNQPLHRLGQLHPALHLLQTMMMTWFRPITIMDAVIYLLISAVINMVLTVRTIREMNVIGLFAIPSRIHH